MADYFVPKEREPELVDNIRHMRDYLKKKYSYGYEEAIRRQRARQKPKKKAPDLDEPRKYIGNSSEKSFDFEQDGKHILVPSILDGVKYEQEDIIKMYNRGELEPIGIYDSAEEATKASKERSNKIPPPPTSKEGFDALFEKYGKQYNIDPLLLKAIAMTESSMNPKAVSPRGAQGLMQIMPGRMQEFAEITDPFDPEQSVRGGAKILADELVRFGNEDMAMAAYNMGATDLITALKNKGLQRGQAQFQEVADVLPEETRNYVPKIRGYHTEYSQPTAKPRDYFVNE